MSANRRLILKIGAVLERFIIFFHLLLYRKGLDFQHRRSLSAYLKHRPLGKIRLRTMRQDLARGLVLARSRIPIPPEISFYPVFRQTPGVELPVGIW